MAIGLISYQDDAREEDLSNVVTNISPKETPLLTGLPEGQEAKQTLHEYLTATFASSSDNAQVEASAFSAVDLTQPSRSTNNTQILIDDILLSGTEMKIGEIGRAHV